MGWAPKKTFNYLKRLEVGAFGIGFQKQIREVYKAR